jgi:hypothetical protein
MLFPRFRLDVALQMLPHDSIFGDTGGVVRNSHSASPRASLSVRLIGAKIPALIGDLSEFTGDGFVHAQGVSIPDFEWFDTMRLVNGMRFLCVYPTCHSIIHFSGLGPVVFIGSTSSATVPVRRSRSACAFMTVRRA